MSFEVVTPLGIKIRTTDSYWHKIVSFKHPSMNGKEEDVKSALAEPEQIRVSKADPLVNLYYKACGRYYVCVVTKKLNGDGFIVTAYLTENIKEGEQIWPK